MKKIDPNKDCVKCVFAKRIYRTEEKTRMFCMYGAGCAKN